MQTLKILTMMFTVYFVAPMILVCAIVGVTPWDLIITDILGQ